MVGAAGFEPTTPSPPVKCATGCATLRHKGVIRAAATWCNSLFVPLCAADKAMHIAYDVA